jgi:hypothetical protein
MFWSCCGVRSNILGSGDRARSHCLESDWLDLVAKLNPISLGLAVESDSRSVGQAVSRTQDQWVIGSQTQQHFLTNKQKDNALRCYNVAHSAISLCPYFIIKYDNNTLMFFYIKKNINPTHNIGWYNNLIK